ncbi:hypothetical protein BH10PSE6_BH10PSE6_05010 [soil metagenome]
MDKAKIDPRLSRALEKASVNNTPVRALVVVGSKSGALPRAESERMLRDMVGRASRDADSEPSQLVVFPNVQSISIEAKPRLLRRLLEEDLIDAASLSSS